MAHYLNLSINDIPGEQWKAIPLYETYYQCSSKGRLKSLARTIHRCDGITTNRKCSILKQHFNKDGYLLVHFRINNVSITRSIHRWIAETFIPNPLNLPEVNHINGNKTDNRIENLEWVTAKENMQHASKNNLLNNCHGESHFNSKLTEKDIKNILYLKNVNNFTCTKIASMYNIAISTIARIVNKEAWKHIN